MAGGLRGITATVWDIIRSVSKLLVLSYIIDWVLIIATAVVGYAFSTITPNHNPFSLTDLSISYPYADQETVTTGTLVLAALFAPAVIIAVVSLLIIPGSTTDKNTPWSLLWRRKIWEWNAGWMGLGVALAGVFMATMGLKDLFGKPRPDMLARCDPDLSQIATYAVSGLGQQLRGAPTVVSWEICQNKGDELKYSGFASFPSGHASFSFAGLTYLTLWLCSKFSIAFPYLAHFPYNQGIRPEALPQSEASAHTDSLLRSSPTALRMSIRNQGAAPPVYLLIIGLVPLGTASFIASSRWFDHRHHGFDILFGSALGVFFAWVGFRLYNLPIRRGAGWSWGARSRKRAFFRGVGFPSHVGDDSWSSMRDTHLEVRGRQSDIESGHLGDRSDQLHGANSERPKQPANDGRVET